MLNAKAFANAATIVVIVISFICWVTTTVAPDFAFSVASSWTHMINLNAIRTNSTASLGGALFGFVSLGVITWVSVYAVVEIYNRLAKK